MAINDTPCFIWVVCNKLTTVWAPTKQLLVSWQFSGPYGVTKHGSGSRKDVVNQCLEFALAFVVQPRTNFAHTFLTENSMSSYMTQNQQKHPCVSLFLKALCWFLYCSFFIQHHLHALSKNTLFVMMDRRKQTQLNNKTEAICFSSSSSISTTLPHPQTISQQYWCQVVWNRLQSWLHL